MMLTLLGLTACAQNSSQEKTTEEITYRQISQSEAKKMMETEKDFIILDVRTQEEFDEKHIENAILIPDYEIEQKAEKMLPDKDRMILVYCRSGRRSKNASQKLAQMGYTNVYEFGGINTWQYGTVTE